MNVKEIAAGLDQCEYGLETDAIESLPTIGDDMVIVFPYSDDGIEFHGAIKDSLGAFDGCTINLNEFGIVVKVCANKDCPHEKDILNNAPFHIHQDWCVKEGYSWSYRTNIPNAEKFIIIEDGLPFGEGLVFSMKSLKA